MSAEYIVTEEQREAFLRDGFVHLPGVLTEEEVDSLIPVYEKFMRQEIAVAGKGVCLLLLRSSAIRNAWAHVGSLQAAVVVGRRPPVTVLAMCNHCQLICHRFLRHGWNV